MKIWCSLLCWWGIWFHHGSWECKLSTLIKWFKSWPQATCYHQKHQLLDLCTDHSIILPQNPKHVNFGRLSLWIQSIPLSPLVINMKQNWINFSNHTSCGFLVFLKFVLFFVTIHLGLFSWHPTLMTLSVSMLDMNVYFVRFRE